MKIIDTKICFNPFTVKDHGRMNTMSNSPTPMNGQGQGQVPNSPVLSPGSTPIPGQSQP